MKKFTVVMTTVLTSILLLAPVAQAATLLRVGSTGSDVTAVQTELTQLGYEVGGLDGIFGIKTQNAVKAFQSAHNLTADGIVGPLTNQAFQSALRDKTTQGILTSAQSLKGVPYLWGGTTPSGFDCSGFTQYVFKMNGMTLPRTSSDQYNQGTPVDFDKLQAGDLVFFNFVAGQQVSHVGIYIGDNQFISATTHKGVISYSFSPYWINAYVGARRVY